MDLSVAYERQIPAMQRLLNGQFYTPRTVCDFMLALVIGPETQRLLEPACGAGNFLIRACECLAPFVSEQMRDNVPTLYGVELDAEAAQLAIQQLDKLNAGMKHVVLTADFISPVADEMGLFDVIIGNPPYVRQEHMAQSAGMDKKAVLAYLAGKYETYLKQYPEQKALFAQTTDLYVLFFLQATTLLKPGGNLAFITSNSWMNTAFGQSFRQFLLHFFHVKAVIESACERWFPDAAVNSLILVLEKKDENASIEPVRFIRLLKPLATWLPEPTQPDYWQSLAHKIQALPDDPNVRMLQVLPSQLVAENGANHWAFLLRAPMDLIALQREPECWRRLEQLGNVRYPLKTGINRFFYLTREQATNWSIEPEFLFPVLRSTRKVQGYRVTSNNCDEFLFSCGDSLGDLEQRGKTGALAYIRWAQEQHAMPRQKRAQPVPWPDVPSVRNHRPWYFVRPLAPAHLLCSRFVDQRFFFPQCDGEVMEDQTFYGITLAEPECDSPDLVAGLLNSTLSYLLVEFNGRTNLGEGVLQFARRDMASLPIVNPDLYSPAEREAIQSAFKALAQRAILPLQQELASPDRLALDRAVLEPLLKRLNWPETVLPLRERLAEHLWNRVQERVQLARSVRKPRR